MNDTLAGNRAWRGVPAETRKQWVSLDNVGDDWGLIWRGNEVGYLCPEEYEFWQNNPMIVGWFIIQPPLKYHQASS